MYWTATPPDGWAIHTGHREQGDAIQEVEKLAAVYEKPICIELLPTQEHEIPSDDPNFAPEHVFASERYCVLVEAEQD